jgi:hypothetical protein
MAKITTAKKTAKKPAAKRALTPPSTPKRKQPVSKTTAKGKQATIKKVELKNHNVKITKNQVNDHLHETLRLKSTKGKAGDKALADYEKKGRISQEARSLLRSI